MALFEKMYFELVGFGKQNTQVNVDINPIRLRGLSGLQYQ